MSPRPKKDAPAAEVEVVQSEDPTPEQVQEADDFLSEPVNQEEFNQFIVNLARNAAQQEIAALEERVRDLEQIVGASVASQAPATTDYVSVPGVVTQFEDDVPDYDRDDTPEYRAEHQRDDGVPWYRG